MRKLILSIIAGSVMLFGLLFIIIFLFFDATFERGNIFTLFTLLGLIPFGGGVFLLIKANRKATIDFEQAIAKQAYNNNGQVTVSDVAMKQSISFKHAEELLTQMYRQEIFEVRISSNGAKVFELLHFANQQQKAQSESLL
jgi:hypothetical protein